MYIQNNCAKRYDAPMFVVGGGQMVGWGHDGECG